ncbi:MAG: peptide-methionine (S)-S-oxide reductase MsrA [bacterium]|nr:peptide-methionine (S)-S-oxide reductase MsrA [bacterium]
MQEAMFAAGCFWGVEEEFRHVSGVIETEAGYSGGTLEQPTYRDVCSDRTGHAEVVHLRFDPAQVSYDRLLDVFWSIHDPTTPNRQGPDAGSQYRSAIFTYSSEQEAAARASLARQTAAKRFAHPIVTQIAPASTFWRAEEYHQRYVERGDAAASKR